MEGNAYVTQLIGVRDDAIKRQTHGHIDRVQEVLALVDPRTDDVDLLEVDGLHINFNGILEDAEIDDDATGANERGHLARRGRVTGDIPKRRSAPLLSDSSITSDFNSSPVLDGPQAEAFGELEARGQHVADEEVRYAAFPGD